MSKRKPLPDIPGYRIEKELARGGMGRVYLGRHQTLDRVVAIKVMARALTDDDMFAKRFVLEARVVADLSYSGICQVHDAGIVDGVPFMVMEFLTAGSLEKRIDAGPVEPAEALRIVREVAVALGVAHEKGYVHRDVKPANIMFRDNGEAVLTDFGIVKSLDTGDLALHTATGMMVGTPHYLSPEQARAKGVDHRSDYYSLGIVLFELLTGDRPFNADSAMSIILKHMTEPIPDLPADLASYQPLVSKMMAKDPEARFANGEAMIAALDEAAAKPDSVKPAAISAQEPAVRTSRTQSPELQLPPNRSQQASDDSSAIGESSCGPAANADSVSMFDRFADPAFAAVVPLFLWFNSIRGNDTIGLLTAALLALSFGVVCGTVPRSRTAALTVSSAVVASLATILIIELGGIGGARLRWGWDGTDEAILGGALGLGYLVGQLGSRGFGWSGLLEGRLAATITVFPLCFIAALLIAEQERVPPTLGVLSLLCGLAFAFARRPAKDLLWMPAMTFVACTMLSFADFKSGSANLVPSLMFTALTSICFALGFGAVAGIRFMQEKRQPAHG